MSVRRGIQILALFLALFFLVLVKVEEFVCVCVCGRGEGGREGSRVNGISLQCVQDQHENGPFTTACFLHQSPTQGKGVVIDGS